MIFDDAIEDIESGIRGENNGLSLGLPKLQEYIPGMQPGNLYTIGGETGSGKSILAVNNFIYNPFEDYLKHYKESMNLKIFIVSCEMSKSALGIRAISRALFKQFGIVADTNYILSRGKNRISTEIRQRTVELTEYFETMGEYVEILPSLNPTGINHLVYNHMDKSGTIKTKTVDTPKGKIDVFEKYTPHKKQLVLVLVDHVSIIKSENGLSKKGKIDKLYEYEIDLRDKFGVSFVNVQQLNRSISNTERFKLGSVEPQLNDFKDSGDSVDSSNYVLAIFSPQRYEISPYRNYIINRNDGGFGDRFRSIKLLKNREGAADKILGTSFIGESGIIQELPKADDLKRGDYDKIINIQKVK